MAKNPKVNINVGAKNFVSFSQRMKNASTIRRMWKMLRTMDCEACGFSCTNGCQMILNQIRTLELESAGGKSEFVNGLDVSETAGNTVPMDLYLATLQMLADKQDETPTPAPATPEPPKKPKYKDAPESESTSDATPAEKPNNSPVKIPGIKPKQDEDRPSFLDD
ncbi:MAG: hypothetical protein ACI4VW_06750 [Acutalibacteraceae bacterium]